LSKSGMIPRWSLHSTPSISAFDPILASSLHLLTLRVSSLWYRSRPNSSVSNGLRRIESGWNPSKPLTRALSGEKLR
jgi:hypothetical protein